MNNEIPKNMLVDDLNIRPIEFAETIPSSWYTDKSIFEFEKNIFLNKYLQYAGHISQIQKTGDYFLVEIANKPLIIINSGEKEYRAFYNVCRHRGGPLALDNGNCKLFQCKYHGWTYNLDGKLKGTPKFDGAEKFEKENYGLFPIKLIDRENLLFITLSEEQIPIEKLIDGIADKISPNKISTKQFYKRVRYNVKCNWKVYVDNYLEGYHLPFVHPGLSKLLVTQKYETELMEYSSLQHSPLQDDDNFYGHGNAYYHFLFPNMMLNILPGRMQVNIVLPLDVDRTLVIFDYYYDEIFSPKAIAKINDDINYSDIIQREDILICEKVQKGLETGVYNKGRFSTEAEKAVHHFQSLLKSEIINILTANNQNI